MLDLVVEVFVTTDEPAKSLEMRFEHHCSCSKLNKRNQSQFFFFILQSFIKEVKEKVTADLKEEMSIMFNGLLSLVGGVLQVCRHQLKAEYLIN